jgi:hypothetical protein
MKPQENRGFCHDYRHPLRVSFWDSPMTPRLTPQEIASMAIVLADIIGEYKMPVLIEILTQLHAEHPEASDQELKRLLVRELTERIRRPRRQR